MREWKPGDVANVQCSDGEWRVALCCNHRFHNDLHWRFPDGLCRDVAASQARRLLVLDRDQPTEDIVDLRAAAATLGRISGDPFETERLTLREIADQIQSQTRPSRPDEPQGLGSVVEDAEGERWMRWEIADRHSKPWCVAGAVKPNRAYADIDAVKVLSEGVTA